MRFLFSCLAIFLPWLITNAHAADIAGDVQNGLDLNTDGGYIEVGLFGGYRHNPYQTNLEQEYTGFTADIEVSGVFRKSGFFVEGIQGTMDGFNLGYTAHQSKHLTVDLIAASMNHYYEPYLDNKVRSGDDEETRNKKLYNRNSFYHGTGIRITHYITNYVFQYRFVTDTLDNNGLTSTFRFGRGWQYRNWNFYSILGANYTSAKTNNYWFGVKENEATEKYPTYEASDSLSFSMQFGITKPLTEKWVAKAYFGWVESSQEARQSPFVTDSDYSYIGLAVNRVFSWGQ